MIIYPLAYQLEHEQVLLSESFHDHRSDWKVIVNEHKRTFIRDNHYWMENLSEENWLISEKQMPVNMDDDWFLEAEIETVSAAASGNYGLMWGCNENSETMNCFTVSSNGKYASVMHIDKGSQRVLHYFEKTIDLENAAQPIRLSILKMGDYYYFLINQNLFYICEVSHFANSSSYAGYYVEPGLFIRSRSFTISKMLVKKEKGNLVEHLYL